MKASECKGKSIRVKALTVSHRWILTSTSPTGTVVSLKSTPSVLIYDSLKSLSLKALSKLVFPTPELPTITNFAKHVSRIGSEVDIDIDVVVVDVSTHASIMVCTLVQTLAIISQEI